MASVGLDSLSSGHKNDASTCLPREVGWESHELTSVWDLHCVCAWEMEREEEGKQTGEGTQVEEDGEQDEDDCSANE